VALRTMHDADAFRGDDLDVVGRQPDAVRGYDVVAEEADRVEVGGGGEAGRVVLDLRRFVFRFGDVDEDRRVQLGGERANLLEVRARDGVRRVRREGRRDEPIAAPTLDEIADVGDGGIPRF